MLSEYQLDLYKQVYSADKKVVEAKDEKTSKLILSLNDKKLYAKTTAWNLSRFIDASVSIRANGWKPQRFQHWKKRKEVNTDKKRYV